MSQTAVFGQKICNFHLFFLFMLPLVENKDVCDRSLLACDDFDNAFRSFLKGTSRHVASLRVNLTLFTLGVARLWWRASHARPCHALSALRRPAFASSHYSCKIKNLRLGSTLLPCRSSSRRGTCRKPDLDKRGRESGRLGSTTVDLWQFLHHPCGSWLGTLGLMTSRRRDVDVTSLEVTAAMGSEAALNWQLYTDIDHRIIITQ